MFDLKKKHTKPPHLSHTRNGSVGAVKRLYSMKNNENSNEWYKFSPLRMKAPPVFLNSYESEPEPTSAEKRV